MTPKLGAITPVCFSTSIESHNSIVGFACSQILSCMFSKFVLWRLDILAQTHLSFTFYSCFNLCNKDHITELCLFFE